MTYPADQIAWRDGDLTLTAADLAQVAAFAAKAMVAEPTITTHLQRAADRYRHAHLDGLEHRLKTMDSMARKVATEKFGGKETRMALRRVKDPIRYTLIVPDEHLSVVAPRLLSDLSASGYTCHRVHNAFADVGYQGINTRWTTSQGVPFEVQFHTPASRAAGKATHAWYERWRLPSTPTAERDTLRHMIDTVYATVPTPADVEQVGARDSLSPPGRDLRRVRRPPSARVSRNGLGAGRNRTRKEAGIGRD